MAHDPAVCVSAGGSDTAHSRSGASGGSVADSGGILLASKDVVYGHHGITIRDAMVSSPVEGPAVTGRRADSVSSARALVSVGLRSERENLMAAGLPINVVATI